MDIKAIRQPIKQEMLLFQQAFSEALKTDNPLLASIHEFLLERTGKLLRPTITLLSAKLCGVVNEKTINSALSLELLHNASLMHDDVVDETLERRGKPSINARWNNKAAVLSGDYMLSNSLLYATKTESLKILDCISNIGVLLADGELLQLANTQKSGMSEDDYFNVIRKKTAALFAASAKVGAISVDASKTQIEAMYDYGENLGICFQLKDDIFDYYEDIKIGKPTQNDIREGKVTLPLIYALRNTEGAKKIEISNWINYNDFSTENIKTIIRFAHENGGIEYAEKQMEIYKNRAIEAIGGFADNDVKKSLIICAEFAAARDI
ncbi:MAG: polyprenyl synthetase family protein [Prevotellaceae bacterium]|jgi:octaprenyl-diphosphate synthase|nr:polyprenyl synthetase family protein [Prevotellaceae bacterium]